MASSLDRCDSYEDQLRSLFISCGSQSDTEALDKSELVQLCHKLELSPSHSQALIQRLVKASESELVSFDIFKEGLVSLLEQIGNVTSEAEESKVVNRTKKYGRRSRPSSVDLSDDGDELDQTCKPKYSSSLDIGILNDRRFSGGFTIDHLQSAGMTEREYLQSIWDRLEVGSDGHIDRLEFGQVCDLIGMEKLPPELVEQLFTRLDTDTDGRVHFDELLSLFQSGRTFSNSPPPCPAEPLSGSSLPGSGDSSVEKSPQSRLGSASSGRRSNQFSHHSSPHSESLKQTTEYSYFSALDALKTGFCNPDVVLEYVESLGILNPTKFLEDYRVSPHQSEVDLKALTNLMDDDLDHSLDSCPPNVRSTVVICQNEVRFLRNSLDNVTFERDKLRVDIRDANQRSLLLAQEIDDQNARLERSSQLRIRDLELKYVDQIQELHGKLSSEKEQHQFLSLELDSKRRMITEQMNEKEGRMREEISFMEKENIRLEKENSALGVQLQEMAILNQHLQNEMETLALLKKRLLELEGTCVTDTEETIVELNGRIEELHKMNKDLQDQNDELHMQVESAKLGQTESRRSSAPFVQSSSGSIPKPQRFGRSCSLKYPLKRSRNPELEEDPDTSISSSEESASLSSAATPREGKVAKTDLVIVEEHSEFPGPIQEESLLTSLSVELGTAGANLPVIDNSPPSSLGSIDDTLVMGNLESSPAPTAAANRYRDGEIATADLKAEVSRLEVRCQRLQEEKKTKEDELLEDIEILRKAKQDEIQRIKDDLEATNMKLSQVLTEKGSLEDNLRQSTFINVSLTNEMKKVDSEMETVQSRLLSALGEIDHCQAKQASDEERITVLTGKCSKLEDRLRESVITLGSPASTLSRSSSNASSSRTTSTIHSSNSNENIQIIAVRHNTSPPQHKRSNSPCVSKIIVNSEQSSPVTGPRSLTSRPLTSSASFSGLFKSHSLSMTGPSGGSSVQPLSLPMLTSNAIKRSRSTSDNERAKVQVFQLEQHCKNLEGELDHVKDEIIKILSDKTNASKENQSLKHYAKAYETLKDENAELKKELALFKLNPPKSPTLSSGSSHTGSESGSDAPEAKGLHHIDRSSPDGQEYEGETTSSTASSPSICHKIRLKSTLDKTKEEETAESISEDQEDNADQSRKELLMLKAEHVKTREEWTIKISQLEESLELMRNEFENMEDYWQGKLDEERVFYENQLKTSDINFKDLEMRMKEYEELLLTSESVSNPESEKLSTIAETVSLEGQVTDMETEIYELKEQVAELTKEKEDNVQLLDDQWQEKLLKEQETFDLEREKLEKRIGDLAHKLKEVSLELERVNQAKELLSSKYNQDVTRLQGSYTKMQEHLRRTHSVSGAFVPQSKTKIQIKQPSSLPPDIIGEGSAQSDLHRLHEFRRVIQDECDQLLLRRDQLQQDVVGDSFVWFSDPPRPQAKHAVPPGSGSLSLDSSIIRFHAGSDSVQTEDPSHFLHSSTSLGDGSTKSGGRSGLKDLALFKSSALSSMARAYKAVLQDIEREKSNISDEMQEMRSSKQKLRKGITFNPIKALQNRLKHQEARCKHLRDALQLQQDQSNRILQVSRDQHRSEIENLETLIKVNQEILHSQMTKYTDQMHRLIQSDALVKQLSTQNESLILAIQMLEDTLNDDETGEETRECLNTMCKILVSDDSGQSQGSSSSCASSDCGSLSNH